MSGKFYWLKLKEDFFQQDAIEWLEEQDNGSMYALFYLKLCLKSLKTDGVLIRNVGDIFIPYSIEKLSDITRTPKDTVIVALELLKEIGLIQLLEDGSMLIPQVISMTGSNATESHADRQKKYRERLKEKKILEIQASKESKSVTRDVTCVTRDRDKRIEREIEIETECEVVQPAKLSNNLELFDKNISPLTPMIAEDLMELEQEVGETILAYAIRESVRNNVYRFSYVKAVALNRKREGNRHKPNPNEEIII